MHFMHITMSINTHVVSLRMPMAPIPIKEQCILRIIGTSWYVIGTHQYIS